MKLRERNRILVMTILLSICVFLTFYFHGVRGIGTVFTHFFYIPIIFASIWWKRKGIIAALFLAILLILSRIFMSGNVSAINDFLRAPLFIVVGLVTAVLSERIAKGQKALQESYDKSEQRITERTSELKLANEQLVSEVNERRHAEEALRESERRFRQVAESAEEWIWEVDENALYTYASPVVEKLLGYKPEELVGKKHSFDLFHPDDIEPLKKATFELFNARKPLFKFLNRNIHKNGKVVWLSTSGVPIIDEKGNLQGYRGADTDITEQKKAEEALRESEEKYRTVFENTGTATVIIEEDTIISLANAKFESLSGYSREEIEGKKSWTEFVVPEDLERMKEQHKLRRKDKDTALRTYEFRFIDRNNNVKNILLSIDMIPETKKSLASLLDITERKKAEEALLENEEKYRTLTENINVGIYRNTVGPEGKFIEANPAIIEMFGFESKDEFLASKVSDLYQNPAERKKFNEKMLKNEFVRNEEERLMRKDGASIIGLVSVTAVKDEKGEVQYYDGIILDITKRKKAEEERERLYSELIMKIKELEQMIFVVSHDLRSPLVNVGGFSSELELSIKELIAKLQDESITNEVKEKIAPLLEEDIPEALQFIMKNTEKMDTLISGLLKLSRLGRAELTIVKIDMNKLISDVINTRAFQIKDLDVKLDVGNLPPCKGDRKRIDQLFSNLLDNALKYLDPKRSGTIKISGYREKKKSIYCIEDNGIGIAQEHQKKIFEIFHQLDPETSSGEGLGLNIANRIIEKHHGKIWIESEYGKGSKFYVAIPMK